MRPISWIEEDYRKPATLPMDVADCPTLHQDGSNVECFGFHKHLGKSKGYIKCQIFSICYCIGCLRNQQLTKLNEKTICPTNCHNPADDVSFSGFSDMSKHEMPFVCSTKERTSGGTLMSSSTFHIPVEKTTKKNSKDKHSSAITKLKEKLLLLPSKEKKEPYH